MAKSQENGNVATADYSVFDPPAAAEIREMEAKLAARKAEQEESWDKIRVQVEIGIQIFGAKGIADRINYLFSGLGWSMDYTGVFNPKAAAEILSKIKSAPKQVCDLNTETLGLIALGCSCRVEDCKTTLRVLLSDAGDANPQIASHNPDTCRL